MSNKKLTPEELAAMPLDERIAYWKHLHKAVYSYDVGEKTCYLKVPSRHALGLASVVGKQNMIKYNEVLVNNCWLGGDEEIRTKDSYFLGLSGKIASLIDIKEGELKKL